MKITVKFCFEKAVKKHWYSKSSGPPAKVVKTR